MAGIFLFPGLSFLKYKGHLDYVSFEVNLDSNLYKITDVSGTEIGGEGAWLSKSQARK